MPFLQAIRHNAAQTRQNRPERATVPILGHNMALVYQQTLQVVPERAAVPIMGYNRPAPRTKRQASRRFPCRLALLAPPLALRIAQEWPGATDEIVSSI